MQIAEPADPLAPASAQQSLLRIAVGIATVGRPEILHKTLTRLKGQTRRADAIIVSTPTVEDVAGVAEAFPDVALIVSEQGLPRQRNAILDHLDGFDVVVFLDDDFIPAPDYLAALDVIMTENPDIVMTTGFVLRDGILGPGLTFKDADSVLADAAFDEADKTLAPVADGYGCNMSARLSAVREYRVRFDETLPLYAWLEDVDFSQQLARGGRIVKAHATRGVHLGVKSGRQRGLKLGYSQIANPIYLSRKGTCPWRRSLFLMSRNIAANALKTLRPEPWVDRRGRLLGNLRAIADLVTGRLDPRKVLSFK
jgi:GT2 family glycosyltransferase